MLNGLVYMFLDKGKTEDIKEDLDVGFLQMEGPERLLVKMCLFGIILVYNTEIGKGNPLILCNFAYL